MTPRALRFAAVAGALSAVTTFLLWLLPNLVAPAGTFDEQLARHRDPLYLASLWNNWIHVLLALVAYAGAAWLLARRSLALAGFGFLAFVLWAVFELVGVTLNLFAVNFTWRASYAAADPATQTQLQTLLAGFPAIWDGLFFLVLVFFLLGTLCLGIAAFRATGLEKLVGVLLLAAVPLTLLVMLGGYTRHTFAAEVVAFVYPILQPVSRLAMALWLWRGASRLGYTPPYP